jgi:hypothetical protein
MTGSTGRNGIFQTTYRTTLVSGFCTITATVGKSKGSVMIDQESPLAKTPYVIGFVASSTKLSANGTSTTTATATVTNDGKAVSADPVIVTSVASSNGSCGAVVLGSATTNSSGQATAVYTSSTVKGTCQLKATEAFSGSSSGAVVIQQH